MNSVTYTIQNISCMHCVNTIKSELSEMDGVIAVDASQETKIVKIEFEPPATEAKIKELLTEINYPVS